MLKLLPGLHKFKTQIHSQNQTFFGKLSKGQKPEAIFITCSDSRVDPNLITQTSPGELFVIRNAGNIIPPHDAEVGGEDATIEFAITSLGIRQIIVCGHSGCGAMQGLLHPEKLTTMPAVASWLRHARKTKEMIDEHYKDLDFESALSIAIQQNVLVQLEHLRTLPCIARRVMKREIELHGWVYKIDTGDVYIYNEINDEFEPVSKSGDDYGLDEDRTFTTAEDSTHTGETPEKVQA